MSDSGLKQRQKDMIGLQDDMIQEISFGLDRIQNQAQIMNEEATAQTRLLDAFDELIGGEMGEEGVVGKGI